MTGIKEAMTNTVTEQWSCNGGDKKWDGHPLVYIPVGKPCPYCGNRK